jgi:predicted DNA-binding transcriptional regulator YafY
MRKADRLFQIIQILRQKKNTTASKIAKELEVSVRTIYRDIADLICTGVPIEGEAGVGYILRPGYELPPLMFTKEENFHQICQSPFPFL